MTHEDKITDLIVKLNKLTSMDQLIWTVQDAPHTILRGTDDHVPLFMSAIYKNQRFGLYQQRYQLYDGDSGKSYWTERTVLAIFDFADRMLWETSGQLSALSDLFETARRKVSNIEGLLDNLLADDDETYNFDQSHAA